MSTPGLSVLPWRARACGREQRALAELLISSSGLARLLAPTRLNGVSALGNLSFGSFAAPVVAARGCFKRDALLQGFETNRHP